jgi:hypothetical protein
MGTILALLPSGLTLVGALTTIVGTLVGAAYWLFRLFGEKG